MDHDDIRKATEVGTRRAIEGAKVLWERDTRKSTDFKMDYEFTRMLQILDETTWTLCGASVCDSLLFQKMDLTLF